MSAQKTYTRFTLDQRIEHVVQLVSFTVLAVTGLPQKYASAPISEAIIAFLGGIEQVRRDVGEGVMGCVPRQITGEPTGPGTEVK